MRRELVPLRIPSGWAVIFNIFVEFADDEVINDEDVEIYLSQDILSIEQIVPSEGEGAVYPDRWYIDLGWSEPGSIAGQYELSVLYGGWDSVASFRSAKALTIRRAIDRAFEIITRGAGVDRLDEEFARLSSESDHE